MTGQVKEGVLIRWAELGVRVRNGRLHIDPVLLDPGEFLAEATPWEALGPDGVLAPGSLGFTYCSVPVVYTLGDAAEVEVRWADGRREVVERALDTTTSRAVFERTGAVAGLDVTVIRDRLLTTRNPDALGGSDHGSR